MEEGYVDKSKISLREINTSVAKDLIIKNHYSHAWTMCSCAIGIFYNEIDETSFFENDNQKLIGALIYGHPVGRSAAASICSGVKINEVYELTRLWIKDGHGKNIESYCISQSFRYLKAYRPKIKLLISYSDPGQNHLGGIYQATNWIYQGAGLNIMDNYSISLFKDPYKWIHSRTVSERWGSHNVEFLRKTIGKPFWRRKEPPKHRYIYFLTDKKETKKLKKQLKHPIFPYPKNTDDFNFPIEYYEPILDSSANTFFE